MRLRSLLFVPGDSERKFARARTSGADALILDLEDAVAPSQKEAAREHVASVLGEEVEPSLFVRVNPFDTGLMLGDLAAIVRPGLAGIMLPKVGGAGDLVQVGHYLDALEAKTGLPAGGIALLPVATETPAAMFALGSYAPAHSRLCGLTWGAEDLAAAVGATANREESGGWTEPYRFVRTQCLFAAAAAEVAPIDTLYADFRDMDGLAADCRMSRRDGFTGRLAIHPDQVEAINAGYSPSAEDLAFARRVADAFAAEPGAGAIGIDGKMYDVPHLKAALRTLASA